MNERQHIALTEAQIIAAEKGELQLETRDGRKVVQLALFREPFKQNENFVLAAVLEDGRKIISHKSGHYYENTTLAHKADLFVSEAQTLHVPEAQTQFSGYLKGVPPEIIEQMLIEQQAQGNKPDASVFDKVIKANRGSGGFDWCDTKLNGEGWRNVCEGDYTDFYKMYGKPEKSDLSEPKPLYKVGEIIEVGDYPNPDFFQEAPFFALVGDYVLTKEDTDKTPLCWLYHRKKQKTVTLDGKVMTITEAIEYLTNLNQ